MPRSPRRSVLFSPGDRPELMWKAARSEADTLVFDLEDAVVPAEKPAARSAVREVLSDPEFDPDAEVCLRVSVDPETDIDAVLAGRTDSGDIRLDGVVVPKAESERDVEAVASLLCEHGERMPVLALVETARGVLRAEAIADANPSDALLFGAEDLSASLGATRTDEGTEVLYAREHVVLAAAAAGIDAVDTVHTDFEDTEGLREEAEFARDLGYGGKMAIHPAQVPVINDAFAPDPETVEWAERVLAAREDAEGEGRGVFEVDGEMIDAPLVARAERIISMARADDDV